MDLEEAFTISVHDKKNKKHRSKTYKIKKGKQHPTPDQVMQEIEGIFKL